MNNFIEYLCNPETIALVIGGTLTSLFAFLSFNSGNERTPKWLAWGSFIAGIIVLCAGFYAGYQDKLFDSMIQKKTSIITKISQQNVELSMLNSELNKKNADLITGGDSFCYVLIRIPGNSNTAELLLVPSGENALYDVKVYFREVEKNNKRLLQKIKEGKELSRDELLDLPDKVFDIGNLGKNTGSRLGGLPLSNNEEIIRYHIEILARNGRVFQFVKIKKINGKWRLSTEAHFRGTVVYSYIHPDFQRDKSP